MLSLAKGSGKGQTSKPKTSSQQPPYSIQTPWKKRWPHPHLCQQRPSDLRLPLSWCSNTMAQWPCWNGVGEGQAGSWDFHAPPEVMRCSSFLYPLPSCTGVVSEEALWKVRIFNITMLLSTIDNYIPQCRWRPYWSQNSHPDQQHKEPLSGGIGSQVRNLDVYLHPAMPSNTSLEWYQRESTKTGGLNKMQSQNIISKLSSLQ